MWTARLLRAERVADVRRRVMEQAESDVAQARRVVDLRQREALEAASVLERQLRQFGATVFESSSGLADANGFVRSLAVVAERARGRVAEAQAEAELRQQAVLEARVELKKIEAWQESLRASAREVQDRLERLATDDHAARSHRKR